MLKRIQTIIAAGTMLGAALLPARPSHGAGTSIATLLRTVDGANGCLATSYRLYLSTFSKGSLTGRMRADAAAIGGECDRDLPAMEDADSCGKPRCYGLPSGFGNWALAKDYAHYGMRAELDAGVVFAAFAIGEYPPIAVLYEWKSATPRWYADRVALVRRYGGPPLATH